MKRGRSTGTPTKAEAERIVKVKEGPCLACLIWHRHGNAPNGWSPLYGCDYHHLKSGNLRIGHMAGIGLCPWHHRGMPDFGFTVPQMRQLAGPSLMDGGKVFARTYGTDAELLELQKQLLGESDEL